MICFKLALISKGLRPCASFKSWALSGFKLALISKGLRRWPPSYPAYSCLFQACPDFKGIKTGQYLRGRAWWCFKLALISKGLRRHEKWTQFHSCRFKLALISKGLRLAWAHKLMIAWTFQACPDFKGIKTIRMVLCLRRYLVSSLPWFQRD